MRLLMLAALLLTTMPVAAQYWVMVGETESNTFYIDPGAILVNGHLRRVWLITDLKQRDPKGQMSRCSLHEYDCKEAHLRLLSLSAHSEPMGRGKALVSGGDPSPSDYIAPGTIAEDILIRVCAVKPAPAAPAPQRQQHSNPSGPLLRPL